VLLSASAARPSRERPLRVLVVCTGNSARSVMAEALLQHHGRGLVEARSAGSNPTGRVHPCALEQVAHLHPPARPYRSKSIEEVLQAEPQSFDLVLTVCDHAAEHCPIFPGDPRRIHWGLSDPAAHTDGGQARDAFAVSYRELERRIRLLLEEIPTGETSLEDRPANDGP
jgi:arsenate reductase (thioredoxin)